MSIQDSQKKFNAVIRKVGKKTKAQLAAQMAAMSIHDTGALMKSIKVKYKKYYGWEDRISFPFLYYGIFIAKGKGRGSDEKRKERDWFSSVLELNTELLAEELAKAVGDDILEKSEIISRS